MDFLDSTNNWPPSICPSMKGAAQRHFLKATRAKTQHAVNQSKVALPRSTTFLAAHSATYNPNMHILPWVMEDPSHLLYPHAQKAARVRAQEGLWWTIMAPMATSSKRIVRSWVRRRLATAFQEALLAKGYDVNGIFVGGTKNTIPADNLVGSLRLMANVKTVVASKSLIDSEIFKLVDHLCLGSHKVHVRSIAADYATPTSPKRIPPFQRSGPKMDHNDDHIPARKVAAHG